MKLQVNIRFRFYTFTWIEASKGGGEMLVINNQDKVLIHFLYNMADGIVAF